MNGLNSMDHAERSAETVRWARLAELENELRRLTGMLAALDLLPIGVIVLDGEGRVLKSNAMAKSLLARADGLIEQNDGLGATNPKSGLELRRAITTIGSGHCDVQPMAMWLPRLVGKPLSVTVAAAPMRGFVGADTVGLANVVVFTTDPDLPLDPAPGVMQQLFSLTPAEARVAECIVGGQTIDQTAVFCRVTRGTVRTHLKRVFEKTEVSSQSALVRKVINTPAWIGRSFAPRV